MSFCYSDTRSARHPYWPRSQPVGEAGPTVGHFGAPPPPLLALNKEMQRLSVKEGGSSLEKEAAKTPLGCYSGAAALGKQILSERDLRVGRLESEPGVSESFTEVWDA